MNSGSVKISSVKVSRDVESLSLKQNTPNASTLQRIELRKLATKRKRAQKQAQITMIQDRKAAIAHARRMNFAQNLKQLMDPFFSYRICR